jgi:hypothetical protein
MKTTPTLGKRKRLVHNLLLLDGISRSGKFVLANLINGLDGVEPVQYSGVVEHTPYLAKLGLMKEEAAKELLHHEIDLRCYETLIGRTLNYRRSDKSSIFNVANHEMYLRRSQELDTNKELTEFYKRDNYSLFISHEALPVLDLMFSTFPKMRVVSLRRSPVDLVHAWCARYAIDSWGSDPKFVNILLAGKKTLMPLYMYRHAKEFEALRGADRAIFTIELLFKEYGKAERRFTKALQKKILVVRYEDILEETEKVIWRLSKFLGKKPTKDMEMIFSRLHLPNPNYSKGKREARIADIKAQASPRYFEKLMELEKTYYTPN